MAEEVKKLPGDVSHLQRLIGDHAPDRGMPPERLQRWLNAMIITAVLDRVRDERGEPVFLLKGGLAMELRLQLRARATGDYDAAFRARAEEAALACARCSLCGARLKQIPPAALPAGAPGGSGSASPATFVREALDSSATSATPWPRPR